MNTGAEGALPVAPILAFYEAAAQAELPPEGDVESQTLVMDARDIARVSAAAREKREPTAHNSPKQRQYQLVPVHDIAEKGQTIPGYSGKLGAPVKRNALCPCSSGKKFKVCHGKRS